MHPRSFTNSSLAAALQSVITTVTFPRVIAISLRFDILTTPSVWHRYYFVIRGDLLYRLFHDSSTVCPFLIDPILPLQCELSYSHIGWFYIVKSWQDQCKRYRICFMGKKNVLSSLRTKRFSSLCRLETSVSL